MNAENIRVLLHTPGEPAGIGPELLLKLAQEATPACRVAVADTDLLRATAKHLGLAINLRDYSGKAAATPAGTLWVLPQKRPTGGLLNFAQPRSDDAAYLLDCLRAAADLAHAPHSAMITGPLNKASINEAGIAFSGHTEFIAAYCGDVHPVMMLVAGTLRVALATTHLPLRAVPDAITTERLNTVLRILDHDLRSRFGIAQPRIQVCGLNPHAGESGHLGHEDAQIIRPVLQALDPSGLRITGPVPADTAFTPQRLAHCDAVLAMYHDQGLPTLKYAGFGDAVNVTLGLPIVRTSVDHGTAFDIAGRGCADVGSLRAAERLALEMAALQRGVSAPENSV